MFFYSILQGNCLPRHQWRSTLASQWKQLVTPAVTLFSASRMTTVGELFVVKPCANNREENMFEKDGAGQKCTIILLRITSWETVRVCMFLFVLLHRSLSKL